MISMGSQRPKIGGNWQLTGPYLQHWHWQSRTTTKESNYSGHYVASIIFFWVFPEFRHNNWWQTSDRAKIGVECIF